MAAEKTLMTNLNGPQHFMGDAVLEQGSVPLNVLEGT